MLGILLRSALHALGQETRGTIFGRVIDPSSAAVPGAKVTILNTDTNVATELTSNAAGYFEASLLLTGAYRVTVEVQGFEARGQFRSQFTPDRSAGIFSYGNTYTKHCDDNCQLSQSSMGLAWAAFMIGIPDSMVIYSNDSTAFSTPFYAAYIQESWRASNRLTLNVGLRMEHQSGMKERYNRGISTFDPTAALPITAAAPRVEFGAYRLIDALKAAGLDATAVRPQDRPQQRQIVVGTVRHAGIRRLLESEQVRLYAGESSIKPRASAPESRRDEGRLPLSPLNPWTMERSGNRARPPIPCL